MLVGNIDEPTRQTVKEAKHVRIAWEMFDWILLYLKRRPRLMWQYEWQTEQDVLDANTDANLAGCRRSTEPTSGGTVACGVGKPYVEGLFRDTSGDREAVGRVRAIHLNPSVYRIVWHRYFR